MNKKVSKIIRTALIKFRLSSFSTNIFNYKMNCEAKHMQNLIFEKLKEKKISVQRKKYANLGSGSQIKD